MAFSDDVLTTRSFARRGDQIDANTELLALGAIVVYAACRLIDVHTLRRLAAFRRRALAAANSHDRTLRWFVLNVEANVEVDYTALETMDALREELTSQGVIFALARVKHDLLDDLQAFGLAQKISPSHLFPTLPTALDAYRTWLSEHP